MQTVDCVFMFDEPAWRLLGQCGTLDIKFYSLLFKQEIVASQLLSNFLPYRIPRGGLY